MAKYYLYTVIIYVLLTQYQYSICKCHCHRQYQFIRHPKRIEIRGTLKLMCVWAHFCVHLHVFFSKLLQSSCNLIQLHCNCQLLNNGIVRVCFGKGHTGVYNLFCFLPPSSPSESGREVCKVETIWTSDGAVSLSAVSVCEKQQQLSPQIQRVFIRRKKLHNHHIAHIPLIHLCSFQRWRQAEVFTSETLYRSLQICGCAYSTHIETCRDFNILLINKLH